MKYALFILIMLISSVAWARDSYIEVGHPKWQTVTYLKNDIIVKSIYKDVNLPLMMSTYGLARSKFFEFTAIDRTKCIQKKLEIRVVNEFILNNKSYFPDEDYATGRNIVFGRYFGYESVLYIVLPDETETRYYWRSNFAHELVHSLFRDCGISFRDAHEEHEQVDLFLNTYREYFPGPGHG